MYAATSKILVGPKPICALSWPGPKSDYGLKGKDPFPSFPTAFPPI